MAGETLRKMPEEKTIQKRQIAFKVRIKDIVNGKYVKEEGWQPNYILSEDGKRISRASVVATVVQKLTDSNNSYGNLILDDGTSKISVRSFENPNIFKNIDIGGVILLIGRPREFGNEKYILAEIIKNIDPLWIKVRRLELDKQEPNAPKIIDDVHELEAIENNAEVKKEVNTFDVIFNLVREIDKGDGADIGEVITRSNVDNAEKVITSLLEEGELFEIRSGRLKILE